MSRIINGEAIEEHIIKKYKFKELESDHNNSIIDDEEEFIEEKEEVESDYSEKEDKNSEIIQNLLLKIEELSNHIVSIQNQFQTQLNDCKNQIEIEKKNAFEEGYKKGFEEGVNRSNSEIEEKIKLLENSISKIDNVEKVFEEKIISIEKELVSVALDIAKEVISKEISENSKEIAYSLVNALMDEIKDATKVTIKVNPKDAEYLRKKDLKNIEIVEDDAIKEGGVVILSDVGNIDAEIKNRFEAVKDAVLKGDIDENS